MDARPTAFSVETSPGAPAALYRTAGNFEMAARHLSKDFAFNAGFIFPWGVLSAFSVELYLKALIQVEGGAPGRIHDLWDLYETLSSVTKFELATEYDREIRSCEIGHLRIAQGDYVNLEDDLKRSAKAFIEMRYFSQGQTTQTGFRVGLLGLVIRERLGALNPTW
jgi:HEPN domain-containing protein